MALAWMKPLDIGRDALRIAVDTGTNRYFQLRVGRARSTRQGLDWVDEVYLTTPITRNDAGGSLLPATREVMVPAAQLEPGESYVQLVSYKAPDGHGPAFSDVVAVEGEPRLGGRLARRGPPGPGMPPMMPSLPMSVARSTSAGRAAPEAFRPARKLPCIQSPDELAQQTSVDEVLSSIIKVAAPIALKLLAGDSPAGGTSGGGTAGGKADDQSPVAGAVSFLLKMLLSGLQPGAAAPAGAGSPSPPVPAGAGSPAPAAPAGAGSGANAEKATPKSLSASMAPAENRFVAAKRSEWSRPFIFGIDDALLGAIAGPLLNVLPQLVNAANQQRLQTQQANNKLVTDALAQVNQRMLMEQLLAAQQKAQGDQAAQLAALQQQLQALAEASDKPKAQSLAMSAPFAAGAPAPRAVPSKNANLVFVAGDPLPFDGKPRLVFTQSRDAAFRLRFAVGDPVPPRPLPQAILALTLKGAHDPTTWVKVEQRLTNVAANTEQSITVTQADLAKLPANRAIPVIAELRWPVGGGAVHCATGATDIVLAGKYFVRQRGNPVGDEKELTDMGRYRPFWNKIWEAPVLDVVSRSSGRPKSLWELDVSARYVVLMSPREQANGLIETRLNLAPPDPDAIRLLASGRLKGGIELSFDEVNKLGEQLGRAAPLDPDRLAALRSHAVARAESGEIISSIKLKGRAKERGMVWVVPVFRLAEFTLSAVQKTDESGQVVAVADETVRYPVPVAARVLGLRSRAGDGNAEDAADQPYKFDGYVIDVSQKVSLTPIADRRGRTHVPAARNGAIPPGAA